MKLISFVFSFRNEEKNLKNLIDRVYKAVKKTGSWDYEFIFVNDDSTDSLHVGTSAGRSEFQGLRRINNTTEAVTTAISASNGLVAEQ